MAKLRPVNFRIAVGAPDGPRSHVWRGSSHKDEVYLVHSNMGNLQKFSFHSSGICRHAFHEKPESMDDRAMTKWTRASTEPTGRGHMSYALVVHFPTDTLSTALDEEAKRVRWIDAAPIGLATSIEFTFTREGLASVREIAAREGRTVLDYTVLPNGEAFVVTKTWTTWNGEEFVAEAGFAPDSELVIARDDPTNSGRPARLTLFSQPKSGECMIVNEFGAYHVQKGTVFDKPMGRLSRNKIVISSKDLKQVMKS